MVDINVDPTKLLMLQIEQEIVLFSEYLISIK